jgi:hypothetical protein
MRHGVGCADNQHCCPHDTPICDTQQGVCTSEDGSKSVPWTTKVPASYSEAPKPLPYSDDDYGADAAEYGVDGEEEGVVVYTDYEDVWGVDEDGDEEEGSEVLKAARPAVREQEPIAVV